MFLDTVGFTAATHSDEAGMLATLEEEEGLVYPAIASYQGRAIKSTGDGVLAEFESALKATQCAVEIQRRLHERNSRVGAPPILVRIGIHLGDVVARGDDIFGDAVNLASRIEPLAVPGGVCVSSSVEEQVRNKISDRFEKLESAPLKGFDSPVGVFRLVLPWTSAPTSDSSSTRRRLAVLPLANISPDPTDEYFADGLTEELISGLSKVRELRVVARTSVLPYKSAHKSLTQIGAELGVSSILEGSVRKAGSRLRITLQLIDVGTQEHTWSESYDRQLDDVFVIQSDIAERTAAALRVELVGSERDSIRRRPTSNLAAYNLYLKGLHALHGVTYEAYAASIGFLEEAVREDPDFAVACATLANQLIGLSGETIDPTEAYTRARELIDRSLRLAPDLAEAHLARANLAYQDEHDWGLAGEAFRRAIRLNPSSAPAHFWYSFVLRTQRRFNESADELLTAIELDPAWERLHFVLSSLYLAAGDTGSAAMEAEQSLVRDPSGVEPHLLLAAVHLHSGALSEAREQLKLAAGTLADRERLMRAALWAMVGEPREARESLEYLESARPFGRITTWWTGALLSSLGEADAAFEVLERDARGGSRAGFWFHYTDVFYDPIRADPRFQALLTALKL